MRPLVPELVRDGVAVVFIGNGAPHFAQAFDEEFGLTKAGAEVVTDPTRAVYRAAGLTRSLWATLRPRVFAAGLAMKRRGHRGVSLQGDPWQQGGVLVLDRKGNVIYRHVDRWLGDSAAQDDVRESAPKATNAREEHPCASS